MHWVDSGRTHVSQSHQAVRIHAYDTIRSPSVSAGRERASHLRCVRYHRPAPGAQISAQLLGIRRGASELTVCAQQHTTDHTVQSGRCAHALKTLIDTHAHTLRTQQTTQHQTHQHNSIGAAHRRKNCAVRHSVSSGLVVRTRSHCCAHFFSRSSLHCVRVYSFVVCMCS